MDLTSLIWYPISLLTQMGRKSVLHLLLVPDQPMYRNVGPRAPSPLAVEPGCRSLSSGAGQQRTEAAVPRTPSPLALGFLVKLGLQRHQLGSGSWSEGLENFSEFLNSFVALLMGYDKRKETNLTKEKKMGFDLYSLGNHKTENGEYFRNNVWWWRRLADFVCTHTGVVEEKDKPEWQSNGGHEVSEEQAMQIAKQLKALIKDGTVSKAIKEVEDEMIKAEENNKFVDRCHDMLRNKVEKETGKENLAPADYPKDDHDTWDWIQSKYSYGSSYPFTMENVERFIEFCEQSNGFRIC